MRNLKDSRNSCRNIGTRARFTRLVRFPLSGGSHGPDWYWTQDEDILCKHDYTEATASTVDVSLLPKVMQVRDFGKRSRTKYTHLLDQDTTVGTGGFGGVGLVKPGTGFRRIPNAPTSAMSSFEVDVLVRWLLRVQTFRSSIVFKM